jgi:hypothetical protein
MRAPTDAEYFAYDGMHCRWLWKRLPESWRCPCCGRGKGGILRWGQRIGANAIAYGPMGWKAGLQEHHDHSGRDRFEPTVICDACDLADAMAMRSCAAPDWFSFSPAEIRRFVTAV